PRWVRACRPVVSDGRTGKADASWRGTPRGALVNADDLGHPRGVQRAEEPIGPGPREAEGEAPVPQVGGSESDRAGGERDVVWAGAGEAPGEPRATSEGHPLRA